MLVTSIHCWSIKPIFHEHNEHNNKVYLVIKKTHPPPKNLLTISAILVKRWRCYELIWVDGFIGICLSERDQDRYILSCNELRTIYYQPLRLYFLLSSYQSQNLKCLLLAIVFCFAVIISCAYFVRRGLHIRWYSLLSKPIVYVQ